MNNRILDGCEVLLVCEGGQDAAFVRATAKHMGMKTTLASPSGSGHRWDDTAQGAKVFVLPLGGAGEFRQGEIKTLVADGNFEGVRAFGMILDADHDGENPAKRTLDKINGVVRLCFGADSNFLGHGDVKPLKSGKFAGIFLGAFVMPDGKAPGEMENLLLQSIGESHPEIMDCVDAFLECARSNSDAGLKKESKKRVQAFLAGLPEHCPGLNTALEGKHIHLGNNAFADLRAFLQKLAEAERP